MPTLQKRIIRVARVVFKAEDAKITGDTSLAEDLKGDSVDINEFHYQLELEFDLQLPDSVPATFATIKDVEKYIDKKIKQVD